MTNDKASDDLVERVTDELLAHGEFSSGANNRSNAREAARVVIEMATSAFRAQLAAAEATIKEQNKTILLQANALQTARKALEEICEGPLNTGEIYRRIAREALTDKGDGK